MLTLSSIRIGDTLPERLFTPDTVQLFMYNAAIWNPHRIHYDHPYTQEVEGHPGLLIDGPLQGDWLSQIVLEWIGDAARLATFEYSNRQAAYVGETLRAAGSVEAVDVNRREVRLQLAVFNEQGQVVTPGAATVRFGA